MAHRPATGHERDAAKSGGRQAAREPPGPAAGVGRSAGPAGRCEESAGMNERTIRRHRRSTAVHRAVIAFAMAMGLGGCVSMVPLDRAVLTYDTTTADNVSKQLLLNIARARHNEPMHFTAVSSITATYKFGVNAGLGAAATGDRGGLLVPGLGAVAEENPTISIAPMQGEEFTERLLTPFAEHKLTLLLRQGYDIDSLLRLMGAGIRLQQGSGRAARNLREPPDRRRRLSGLPARGRTPVGHPGPACAARRGRCSSSTPGPSRRRR